MIQEYICKLCFKKFKNNGFGKHIIGIHHISIKSYYDEFLKKENEGLCWCGSPTTFYSLPYGYLQFCSHKHSEIGTREKRKNTCYQNFGGPSPYHSKEVREKGKITCLENWGFESSNQSQEVRNKKEKTCIKKYGFKNPMQSELCKEKSKQTSLKKYGFEYPIQNLEVFLKREKQCFKRKEFAFPSGNIMIVQGEEPQFLNHIILQNIIKENEIQKGPKFQYYIENKKIKNYFSDFLIKHLNLIIEIKSSYILNNYEKYMKEKEECVKKQGFNFILIIDQDYNEFDKLIIKLKENKNELHCT